MPGRSSTPSKDAQLRASQLVPEVSHAEAAAMALKAAEAAHAASMALSESAKKAAGMH